MLFTYKARDKQGELVVGKLEEKNEASLIAELEKMGYSVIEVKAQKGFAFSLSNILERFKPLDKKDVIIFTRQMSTLLRTGTGLAPGLSAVSGQVKDRRLNEMIEDIRQSVQSGSSFSEALSKYPQAFSELYISMVEVGEAGGMLDQSLDRLADLGRQEMEM
ncbi:MAG: type II secretion system F family protein, partial [Candidatus Omnitrophota bacterium]